MSDYLPVSAKKHFKPIIIDDAVDNAVLDFCADALLIPVGHIVKYALVPDMDAYYVYTRTGWRFIVTGQEIYQWDKDPICAPYRGGEVD